MNAAVDSLRKSDWIVDVIALGQGQELVCDLHYAKGAANTATFRHGIFRRQDWPMVVSGAALWIPPTRDPHPLLLIAAWTCKYRDDCEALTDLAYRAAELRKDGAAA